jgi:hypothetical protein
MVGGAAHVGNFISMVTSGEWWRIKKRCMNLSLDRGNKSKKDERIDSVMGRPRNKK